MVLQQGDIVLVNFDPVSGHEQAGRRPALVVSRDGYNRITGLVVVCPITSKIKDYPSNIDLDGRTTTHGQILCHHVRTIDAEARNAKKIEVCPPDILQKVIDTVESIF